jgi:hypothetical protein
MDHKLNKLCLFPCFTLVANICALVLVLSPPRKRGTIGGPHKGNIMFPTILNTYHPRACHNVLNLVMGHGPFSHEKRG